eukprot:gb/GFBE01009418.1/.p1 GENE.gb/GFBE01009418.1/~~gb/GFBE01009418.1/.p1  ORF type:complete len:528 (+),score=90.67 gb/GFBE01009418.1/:1-1584(+)
MTALEILPGQLRWAPERDMNEPGERGEIFLNIADHEDEDMRQGKYSVPHYGPEALGDATGPLALDQTVRFCQLLESRLALKEDHQLLTIVTYAGDPAARANAAVLLGAFLMLCRDWSLQSIVIALRREAETSFPCSWSGKAHTGPPKPDVLRVRDCWAGLHIARECSFLDIEWFKDSVKAEMQCGAYRRTARAYDASWLVPGRILVTADPVTVLQDPNPETCSELLPTAEKLPGANKVPFTGETQGRGMSTDTLPPVFLPPEALQSIMGIKSLPGSNDSEETETVYPCLQMERRPSGWSGSTCPNEFVPGDDSKPQGMKQSDPREGKEDSISTASDHTVDKTYGYFQEALQRPSACLAEEVADWVSWCKDEGIKKVVRANLSWEKGIEEHGGSYDPEDLKRFGLDVLEVPIIDRNGGIPDARTILTVMEFCGALAAVQGLNLNDRAKDAVLIHCKGGFGRSVFLACCLMIAEYDVSGRALLGWVRIARPGAIVTPQQELLLCRFGGREDMKEYLEKNVKMMCTCSVQ